MNTKFPDFPGKRFRKPFDESLAKFEQMVRNNPSDVSALVGLADSYILLWCFGFLSREDSLPMAEAATLKALELDENHSGAHTTLGGLKLSDWDWIGAKRDLRVAIELDPDEPKARHWYALYLSALGQHEPALSESQQAVALDPSPNFKIGLSSILYFAHEFEEMVDLLQEVIALSPHFAPAYDWLGMAYVQLKRFEESITVYQKAVALADGLAEIKAGLGHAFGVAGRDLEAREVLNEFKSLSQYHYIPPVQISFVCVGLGDYDEAFELLEKAYRERSWELVFMQEEPWFDELHADPRFVGLLKRINFPEKSGR
jgi:tetratricopeptide (TPR) repeat protein